jgi:hypothetical protein
MSSKKEISLKNVTEQRKKGTGASDYRQSKTLKGGEEIKGARAVAR